MSEISKIPWLTPASIVFLESLLRPTWHVLEFGAGGSTVWLSERVERLVSIDHSAPWLERVQAAATAAFMHCMERPYANACTMFEDGTIDLVLVDGRDRVQCCIAAERIIKPGGWLVLDNAERSRYAAVHEHFAGWEHQSKEERERREAIASEGGVWRTDFWQRPKT